MLCYAVMKIVANLHVLRLDAIVQILSHEYSSKFTRFKRSKFTRFIPNE
jgi:hypothetical protein